MHGSKDSFTDLITRLKLEIPYMLPCASVIENSHGSFTNFLQDLISSRYLGYLLTNILFLHPQSIGDVLMDGPIFLSVLYFEPLIPGG